MVKTNGIGSKRQFFKRKLSNIEVHLYGTNAFCTENWRVEKNMKKRNYPIERSITDEGILTLKKIEAFGIIRYNFPIQVYDFFAHGIISEYEGVLGLDFLDKEHFCLNLSKNEVTVFG